MGRLMMTLCCFGALLLLVVPIAWSAPSIIMEGNYVKTAVSHNGTLGYSQNTSPGILHDPTGQRNFGFDDYLIPGSPWELFSLLSDQTGLLSNNNDNDPYGDFQTISLENLSGSTSYAHHVRWTGQSPGQVKIINDYFFNDNEQRINMTSKIVPLQDLSNVKFLRSIDPDQDQIRYGVWNTINRRGFDKNGDGDFNDPGDIKPEDWVHAEGAYTGLTIGLYSNINISHNTGVSANWEQTPDFFLSGQNDGDYDYTIGLAFNIGTINAGDSITLSYSYVMGELLESTVTPWVPSKIYEQPPKIELEPPQETSIANKLVFITHGWNSTASDSDSWVNDMATNIGNEIKAASIAGKLPSNDFWTVWPKDWKNAASWPLFDPSDAFSSAGKIGDALGQELAKKNYKHIHFIAHSAGSNMIQRAADYIKKNAIIKPVIHLTFLDAYDPAGSKSKLGNNSDWAEQYVDMRPLVFDWLDTTDTNLSNSYNFDVTKLDTRNDPILPWAKYTQWHGWPYVYYSQSTNPRLPNIGFNLAQESGSFPVDQSPPRKTWAMYNWEKYPAKDASKKILENYKPVIFFPVDLMIVSPTGRVANSTIESFVMTTGSPVWTSIQVEITEPTNVLSLAYEYLSTVKAQGVLTVFVDNQRVFEVDERFVPSPTNLESGIWVGDLALGKHVLSFRLDPYDGPQSAVQISNVKFGNREIVKVIAGDLDGDGDVDSTDLFIFKNALGKKAGMAGYNADCDYDKDGSVSYTDYRIWYGYYTSATK